MYNDLGTGEGKAVPWDMQDYAPDFGLQLVHSVLRSILKELLKTNKMINSETTAVAYLILIIPWFQREKLF